MYFSKTKISRTLSPSNSMFREEMPAKQKSFDDRLDLLEEQLQNLVMNHKHSMLHLNHIVQKVEERIEFPSKGNSKIYQDKIDQLEYQSEILLENEKEEIIEKKIKMKGLVEGHQRILDEMVNKETEKQREIIRELEELINKKVRELKKIGTQVSEQQGSKVKLQKEKIEPLKETPLGKKIKGSLKVLNDQLAKLREPFSKMKKQCSKLLREYLKLLEDIEEGKRDREMKQEQLMLKIQEMISGDVTKEETVSKLQ